MLWASSLHAEQKLTGDEFDAFSLGTTMYFTEDGMHFGSEQFLPNHRSVWRAEDGTCINGKWAEVDSSICFMYDNGDGPHCWDITVPDSGMTITSTTGTPPLVLKLSDQDTRPILCTGPSFGV